MRSVIVSLLLALRVTLRDRAAMQLEILALRHQLHVINRSRPQRLPLTYADRMLWVSLSKRWNGWRAALVIVRPETVLAWHRRGFRLFWTWQSRHRVGDRVFLRMAVTGHPTAAWTAQQLREAFPRDEVPRYLIRDRDHAFAGIGPTATGMGIHEVLTAPRSPWQNAYAERVIRSIRANVSTT